MAGSAANSMARYAELNRSNSTPNQVRGSRRYDWAGLASYAARLFCERIIPVSTVCDRETKASPDRNRHMRSATSSKVVSGNRSLPIRALLGAAAAGSQKRCRAHLPGTLPNRILDGLDRLRPDYWCEIPISPTTPRTTQSETVAPVHSPESGREGLQMGPRATESFRQLPVQRASRPAPAPSRLRFAPPASLVRTLSRVPASS